LKQVGSSDEFDLPILIIMLICDLSQVCWFELKLASGKPQLPYSAYCWKRDDHSSSEFLLISHLFRLIRTYEKVEKAEMLAQKRVTFGPTCRLNFHLIRTYFTLKKQQK
jgi:hypothetical protein